MVSFAIMHITEVTIALTDRTTKTGIQKAKRADGRKGAQPSAVNLREIAVLLNPYGFRVGAVGGSVLSSWACVPDSASSRSLGFFCDIPPEGGEMARRI